MFTVLISPPSKLRRICPSSSASTPVRGQDSAIQNVGGEESGPILLVSGDQLVQVLRTLEVQPVHRFIQQEQRLLQSKGCDQERLFLIAGGQVFQQRVDVVLKVKAPHQLGHVGQFLFVRRSRADNCRRQSDQSQDTTNIDMTHNSFLLEAVLPLMYLHHSRKPGAVRECPQTVGF